MKRLILPHGADELRSIIDSATRENRLLVTVEEYSATRDLDSNAAYWAGIVTPAANQLGYESSDDLHRAICAELYGTKRVQLAGKIYEFPVRTTTHPRTMSRKEFRDHMDRASALVASLGVQLPAYP